MFVYLKYNLSCVNANHPKMTSMEICFARRYQQQFFGICTAFTVFAVNMQRTSIIFRATVLSSALAKCDFSNRKHFSLTACKDSGALLILRTSSVFCVLKTLY